MIWYSHPNADWFEHNHLRFLYKTLTVRWHSLQGGRGPTVLGMWLQVLRVLEVDRKGIRDLLGLCQDAEIGRSYANDILWDACSKWGAKRPYRHLSHKITIALGRRDRAWVASREAVLDTPAERPGLHYLTREVLRRRVWDDCEGMLADDAHDVVGALLDHGE